MISDNEVFFKQLKCSVSFFWSVQIVITVYKRKTVESTDFRSILKISGAKSKVRL